MLDLARRGYLRIEEVDTKNHRGRRDFFLARAEQTKEAAHKLRLHERELMRFLFSEVDGAGNGCVTLQEMQAYACKKPRAFLDLWNSWQDLVRKEADRFGFFDETTTLYRNGQLVAGVIVAATSALAFLLDWMFVGIGLMRVRSVLLSSMFFSLRS